MRRNPGRYGVSPDGMWGNPKGPRCSTVARTTNQTANGSEDQRQPAHLALAHALSMGADVGGGDAHDPGLAERPHGCGVGVGLGALVCGSEVRGSRGRVGVGAALRAADGGLPGSRDRPCPHPRPRRHDLVPLRTGASDATTPLSVLVLTRSPTRDQLGPNTEPSSSFDLARPVGPARPDSARAPHMGPASCFRPGRSSRREASRLEGAVQGGPGLGRVDDLVDEAPFGRHPGGQELGVVALLEEPALAPRRRCG